jgi:D-arginine dehydrogenase
MTVTYDYLVIGAGISGAAAAYELAQYGSVVVIEAETSPGYHSTSRSAALYTPNYGSAIVRRVNQVSSAFFADPPAGFCDHPLLTPRGSLVVAAPGEEDRLKPFLDLSSSGGSIERVTAARALELAPLMRPERVAAAAYEKGVMDIDVAALHQGYLRGVKRRRGVVTCGDRVQRLDRSGPHWRAVAGDTVMIGRVIVNAAGAWAEQIGEMAGASPIGLVPKRRTAIILDPPPTTHVNAMPAIDYVAGDAYLKDHGIPGRPNPSRATRRPAGGTGHRHACGLVGTRDTYPGQAHRA